MRARLLVSALLVGVAAGVSSCGDRSLAGPPSDGAHQGSLFGDLFGRMLLVDSCASLIAEPVSKTIGREGGVIAIGPDTLRIPPKALTTPVTIQASLPAGYFVNLVTFQPEGLHFKRPASLTMGYSNCNLLINWNLRIAQVTDELQVMEYLKSSTNRRDKTVTGQLHHFSNYAVAW